MPVLSALSRCVFAILLFSVAQATHANTDPLTQDEIDALVAALAHADANAERIDSMIGCLAAEDETTTSLLTSLQVRVGDLERNRQKLEDDARGRQKDAADREKEESAKRHEQYLTQLELERVLAEVEATRKAYLDCRKAIRFLGELLCSPALVIHGFDLLVHQTLEKSTKAKHEYIEAIKAAEDARRTAQEAAEKRDQALVAFKEAEAKARHAEIRLSIVKANRHALDQLSFTYLRELGDYRFALRQALDLDLQSTRGSVARKLRREHEHLVELEEGAAALLSGDGIELTDGKRICTFN